MKSIYTNQAPQAIGPYSQAIQVGDFIFTSGQIPVDPETNEIVESNIRIQTIQVMKNIQSILQNEGLDLNDIVKTTIFVKDLGDFSVINEEYEGMLGTHKPARSTVEVSRLPKDVMIEIEAIAVRR